MTSRRKAKRAAEAGLRGRTWVVIQCQLCGRTVEADRVCPDHGILEVTEDDFERAVTRLIVEDHPVIRARPRRNV